MIEERELRRIIGLADACELLCAVTAFPDEALAAALCDGSLVADARACLSDAQVDDVKADAACTSWVALAGHSPTTLAASLRRVHSLLHVRQADGVAAFPYESAFRFVAGGHRGEPGLFRSPLTLDVEAQMRKAGVMPADARTEPCDSIWSEAAFLSFLLGSEAAALSEGNLDAAADWRRREQFFLEEHLLKWLPDFLCATASKASSLAADGLVDEDAVRYRAGLSAWGAHVARLLDDHRTRAAPDANLPLT